MMMNCCLRVGRGVTLYFKLKSMESIFTHILITDKAIIMKLNQNIEWPRSRDVHFNIGTPSISLVWLELQSSNFVRR